MKNIEYYLGLPYTVILRQDEQGDFVARIDELPGCAAHGATEQEALENLKEVKELWISDCIESGQPVPEPAIEELLPSGKWVQRVPRSLHKKLSATAKREGVSLNQLVTSILSEAVGRGKVGEPTTASELAARGVSSPWEIPMETEAGEMGGDWCIRQQPPMGFLSLPHRLHSLGVKLPNRMKLTHAYKEEKIYQIRH